MILTILVMTYLLFGFTLYYQSAMRQDGVITSALYIIALPVIFLHFYIKDYIYRLKK